MKWRRILFWMSPELGGDHQAELEEAQRVREEAELKLRQTRAETPVVNRVAREAIRLRRENHFGDRFQAAMMPQHWREGKYGHIT